MAQRINDAKWIRGAFGLAPMARDRRNLSVPKTSANFKFGDTTFGGNQALNPPPQFTRFADIKATGLLANIDFREGNAAEDKSSIFENEDNAGSYRMGRHYSEVIDDNSQYVHFRFGVPKYTGAIAFFANMYDRDAARLAKTGEYSSIMRDAGTATGLAAMFIAIPMGVIIPLILTAQVLKFALNKKPSRYYYMKPTMNLYLQAVQAMADTQLLHHQLVPMWEPFNADRYQEVGEGDNKIPIEEVYSQLPDIWKSNGKFDIYKAVNRYQTLANYQAKTIEDLYSQAGSEEELQKMLEAYLDDARRTAIMKEQINDQALSLENLANLYAENPAYQINEKDEKSRAEAWGAIKERYASGQGQSADSITDEQLQSRLADAQKASDGKVDPNQTNESFWGSLFDFGGNVSEQLASELKDGGQWITFRVDNKSEMTDSFSNSFKEPEISSTLNSLSSKARSLEVSTSGGNTGFDFVDSAMKGVKNFMGGMLDSLHITGLAAIYGSSYTDIPEVWDSSSAAVGSQSFTLQLRTPYGNDLSIFQDITLPLLFILAGALPLSNGKQTYGQPFLCEMYSRGRQNIRLGMIESVQISRGVGNMGWRPDGKMLACDVTITVKDLSKVMHMPVVRDPSIFDDDNMYTDYMATIGGASLHQMTYSLEKMVFNLNKWKQSWKSAFMSGRVANTVANTMPARALSALTAGSAR